MLSKFRRATIVTMAATIAALAMGSVLPAMAAVEQPSAPYTTPLSPSFTLKAMEVDAPVARLSGVRQRTLAPAAATAATTRATAAQAATGASSNKLSKARAILAGLIKKHPILKGSTVSFGDAKGYQAICYYRSGRIVISNTHKASLERILNHEAWHIIDWRDNGRIDWGENVPPR